MLKYQHVYLSNYNELKALLLSLLAIVEITCTSDAYFMLFDYEFSNFEKISKHMLQQWNNKRINDALNYFSKHICTICRMSKEWWYITVQRHLQSSGYSVIIRPQISQSVLFTVTNNPVYVKCKWRYNLTQVNQKEPLNKTFRFDDSIWI